MDRSSAKYKYLDMDTTLQHIAIIPDGNRRWAKKHDLQSKDGHGEGFKRVKDLIDQAFERDIKYLSFWGSSLTNLQKRPSQEVYHLYQGFKTYFHQLLTDTKVHKNKMKVRVLGRWREKFPPDVVALINKVIQSTKDYEAYHLTFFLGYNGDEEMCQAVQSIVNQAQEHSVKVTPELIKAHLYTKDLPPVDMLIRTGYEPHNSVGFMMWDVANAQLFFPELHFPDFTPERFTQVINDYYVRERRHGK